MPASFEILFEINLTGEVNRLKKIFLGLDSKVQTEILDSWSRTYLLFIRRRFIAAARGDGTWRPLAPATVQARKRKRRGRVLILRDTDTMFEALSPSLDMAYMSQGTGRPKFQAIIDPGLNTQYPNGKPVREVMVHHQRGGPKLPQRKIIVPPDKATTNKMAYDAKRIVTKKR